MSLYTIKEIALQLELPESTVRKYRDIFQPFLPFVGSGRGRKYHEDAVQIFGDIRHLREVQLLSWDTIKVRLEKKYPIAVESVESDLPAPRGRPKAPLQTAPASKTTEQVNRPRTAVSESQNQIPSMETALALRKTVDAVKKLDERNQALLNGIALEVIRIQDFILKDKKQWLTTSENSFEMQKKVNQAIISVHKQSQDSYSSLERQIRETKNGFLKLILAQEERRKRLEERQDFSKNQVEKIKQALHEKTAEIHKFKSLAQTFKQENQALKEQIIRLKAEIGKAHRESVSPASRKGDSAPSSEPRGGQDGPSMRADEKKGGGLFSFFRRR